MSYKYKIAFISEHASPLCALGGIDAGGQNVYVSKMAMQLAARGHMVDIFTRCDNEQLPAVVNLAPGLRVIHVMAGPRNFIPKEELLPYMNAFRDDMLAFIKQQRIKYSLIHAHFFMSALVGCEIKRLLNIPLVVTFHALGHIRKLHQREADKFPVERLAIEERVVQEADQVIAECPQDKADLIRYYHASPEKITMIPCGFDPSEFYPVNRTAARKMLGLDLNEPILLQLGRMVPRKGVDNVIKAMGLVKNLVRLPKLLVVGGSSETVDISREPEMARLLAVAKKAGVEDRVMFTGSRKREQLKYYYSAADIFITTPWYEPFGITPLEAMACGTPVIGSDVGGIKYSVANGKTGYLVPPNDPSALAARVERLLTDSSLRAQMGKNAIKRVTSLFNWSAVATSMVRVYENIISGACQPVEPHQHISILQRLKILEEQLKSPHLHRLLQYVK